MARRLMTDLQESPATWAVGPAQAMRLPAQRQASWLRVTSGRLWLTFDTPGPIGDHWLRAGDRLRLPAGAAVVVEGWPLASFELLLAPTRQPAAGWFKALWRALSSRRRGLPGGVLPSAAA